jgi:tetratricopeptide (TPR) repeat protein
VYRYLKVLKAARIAVNSCHMTSDVGPQFQEEDEFFQRGLALSKQGRWKEAINAYKESLRVNPRSAQTYLNLGFVYYELGYDREAQEAFGTASRLQGRSCVR